MTKAYRLFLTAIPTLALLTGAGSVLGQNSSSVQTDINTTYDISPNGNHHAIVNGNANPASKPNQADNSPPAFVDSEIIIKLKSEQETPVRLGANNHIITGIPSLDILHKRFEVSQMQSILQGSKMPRADLPEKAKQMRKSLQRIYKIKLGKGTDVLQAMAEYQNDPNIEFAEPNYLQYTQATQPNDPSYGTQRYFARIDAANAWDVTTGSHNVVVAIIDTGVNWSHEDLSSNIWRNSDEIEGDNADNDGNGFIDDIRGWDFVSVSASSVFAGEDAGPADNDPMDVQGHGTHVAGIVGADGNNGLGVTGVNWNVSLMPLRAGYKSTSGSGVLQITDTAAALIYAADNGADIVNMSFGSPYSTHTQKVAIDYCISAGVLLVAAAGNDSSDRPQYPANFEGVISVAATQSSSDDRAHFTNHGVWVDIAAPGSSIYSTTVNGSYGYMSGTSMASPVIAGVAALVKAAHPDWNADQIERHLLATAANINSANPDDVNQFGAGRVDAAASVQLSTSPTKLSVISIWPEEQSGNIDGYLDPGETIHLKPTVKNFGLPQTDITVSLTTSDPYISVVDHTAAIPSIGENVSATNQGDPITLLIDPATPKEHWAALTLDISSPQSGIISSDTFLLHTHPALGRPYIIDGHVGAKIVTRAAGGHVVITQNHGASTLVYAKTVDASGNWLPAEEISDAPNISGGKSDFSATIDANGNVHVVYAGNIAPWDAELFYTVQNSQDLTWSAPEQITTNAEIFDQNIWGFNGKNSIGVDNNGQVHVIWTDYRNGHAEFYHKVHNGITWSSETLIAQTTLDINYHAGLKLLFDSNNQGYLAWSEGDSQSLENWGTYLLKWSNGIWGSPEFVTNVLYASKFSLDIDASDNLHMLYANPLASNKAELAHRIHDGNAWSNARTVVSSQSGYVAFDTAIAPDGNLHLAYSQRESNMVYFESQIFETLFDGTSWSIPTLFIKEPLGWNSISGGIEYTIHQDGTKLAAFPVMHSGHSTDNEINLLSSNRSGLLAPQHPEVTDEGDVTDVQTSLSASWSAQHTGGIAEYEYAIGTAPGKADVRDWKPTLSQTSGSVSLMNTPLIPSQPYFFSVRAQNNNGYWSAIGTSDGIRLATNPVPDIKANGLDTPLNISQNENLLVTVTLASGTYLGANAEWWIWADTPGGRYYYTLNQGWVPSQAVVTHQGPLFDLSSYDVLNATGLPSGTYTLHFGVEFQMDGVMDLELMHSDTVTVTIMP